MNSVATRPPELAELAEPTIPLIGGAREGAPGSDVEVLAQVPPVGRAVAQGTMFALLAVQLTWLAFLVLVVVSLVR